MIALLMTRLVLAAAPAPAEAAPPPEEVVFGIGAQTELIGPDVGISALLFALDAGWLQAEVSIGIGVFERGANALQETNVYGFGLRAFVPIHRSMRADFSVGVGGALALLDSGEDVDDAWTVLAGAKVRIFVVPNAAIVGTAGVGALLRDQGNALIVGARPLGSVGFVYYFR
jgi:hypothetical protein